MAGLRENRYHRNGPSSGLDDLWAPSCVLLVDMALKRREIELWLSERPSTVVTVNSCHLKMKIH